MTMTMRDRTYNLTYMPTSLLIGNAESFKDLQHLAKYVFDRGGWYRDALDEIDIFFKDYIEPTSLEDVTWYYVPCVDLETAIRYFVCSGCEQYSIKLLNGTILNVDQNILEAII